MTLATMRYATEIEYPEGDGEPMAESDHQLFSMLYVIACLQHHFANNPNIYVSGNILFYYEKGNPEAVVAPDVLVVLGVPKRKRSSFKLWEEDKGPDLVIEITSKTTYTKDQGPKKGTYAFLGIREYFQYDPTQDYLVPPLQGLRLVGGNYLPIPAVTQPDGTFSVHSNILGLDLRLENGEIRLYNPDTEEKLLSYAEMDRARQTAETRIAELLAELAALKGGA